MRLFLRVYFQCIKSASFLCILFLLCVESVWETQNSDFWFAHFCLPWPYTLSYRNLIVTGGFRTVRPFWRTQKLCWNVKNKGSFDVAKTKKPNFLVIFGKKLKMFLLIATSIFNIFGYFLAPVDRSKCVDSKNTGFFVSRWIISRFNWLRSKNGTKFWPNLTKIIANFWSMWFHFSTFLLFFSTSR